MQCIIIFPNNDALQPRLGHSDSLKNSLGLQSHDYNAGPDRWLVFMRQIDRTSSRILRASGDSLVEGAHGLDCIAFARRHADGEGRIDAVEIRLRQLHRQRPDVLGDVARPLGARNGHDVVALR